MPIREEIDFDIPVALTTSVCSGDVVAVTGHIDATMTTVTSASGNVHVTLHVRYTAVTGASVIPGRKFISDYSQMFEQTLAAGIEQTLVSSGRFLVSGESAGLAEQGDDFYLHSTFHLTMSPGGGPGVTVNNIRAGCR